MRFIEQLKSFFRKMPVVTSGVKECTVKFYDNSDNLRRRVNLNQDSVIMEIKHKNKWTEIKFSHFEFDGIVEDYNEIKNWPKMHVMVGK